MNHVEALTRQDMPQPRPPWSAAKFDAHGRVKHTPGLTFLCNITPRTAAHDALCYVQSELRRGVHAQAFSFLPETSFHMTVFEGVIEIVRSEARWPSDLDVSCSIEAVAENWRARLKGWQSASTWQQGGVRVSVSRILGGYTCPISGTTPADEQALRGLRGDLAEALCLHRDDHAAYGFHTTLAYQIHWLDRSQAATVGELSDRLFDEVRADLSGFALGPVDFCRFQDMHQFDSILSL